MDVQSWEKYILDISKEPVKQAWIGAQPPYEKDVIDFLYPTSCSIDSDYFHKYKVVWIYEQLYETEDIGKQEQIIYQSLKLFDKTGKLIIRTRIHSGFGKKEIEEILSKETLRYELEQSFSYGWNDFLILVYNLDVDTPKLLERGDSESKGKHIAILVEPEFRSKHFSICSYITSIGRFLAENNEVEYITYRKTKLGLLWYRVKVYDWEKEVTVKMRIPKMRLHIPSLSDVEQVVERNVYKRNTDEITYIGTNLEEEQIDICLISNPWVVDPSVKIESKKLVGYVYDLVANNYAITGMEDFVDWAIGHHAGFEYYNQYCDQIYTVSQTSRDRYISHYPKVDVNKVVSFPIFPPFQYRNIHVTGNEKREKSVILAGPFDRRKGIRKLPALLNGIMDDVENIYIFGMTRCTEEEFKLFWQSLKDWSKVTYYPSITYSEAISLYKKSKILIFPSLEEGHGFPIIESQICGCRVVTTNRAPMKELIIEGGYLLTENQVIDSSLIKQMLNETYETRELSEHAKDIFSYELVSKILEV